MNKYPVGNQLNIPEESSLEIKKLHDKLIRLKSKAHHTQTYLLWTRIHALLPETTKGTWGIRHSRTKTYLVKLSERDED